MHPVQNFLTMTILTKAAAGIFLAGGIIAANVPQQQTEKETPSNSAVSKTNDQPKIQVAILLDVSGSMDGLIDQAKAQLWNMVSVMGKAKCNEAVPQIEIALYEYGRDNNNIKQGFVKQLSPFTTDLDQLSQKLFSLQTNGGEEYCGHVIYSSINELNWDTATSHYKVVFIAGNEDFLQGDISFTKACTAAKQKGVIVNTIYCGDRMNGVKEHWNLGGECGNGSYTNINKDAKLDDVETPYDSLLFSLNDKLNGTYIGYGYNNIAGSVAQVHTDKLNIQFNRSAAIKRIAVKGKKELYKNGSWDLIDAGAEGLMAKVDVKTLPDSLQKKTKEELEVVVKAKSIERNNVQKEIAEASTKRDAYIKAAKSKENNQSTATLETEIEKIIKQQASRFNMQIR